MNNKTLEDIQQGWIDAGAGSDLGLWWLADDIRELRRGASEEEIRRETLRAVRPLLERGLLRAVDLLPGGAFQPWQGSIDEQLARIEAEWAVLSRPPDLGDIVWFIGPRENG